MCVCVYSFISHIFTISAALHFSTWVLVTKSVLLFLSSEGFSAKQVCQQEILFRFHLYYIQIHFWMIASDGFRILLLAFPTSSPLAIWLCHSTALWPPYFFYKTLAVNRIVLLYAVIWFFHIPFKIFPLAFIHLSMVCLGVHLFVFILFKICWASGICR